MLSLYFHTHFVHHISMIEFSIDTEAQVTTTEVKPITSQQKNLTERGYVG